MAEQSEKFARLLVQALYAAVGERRWWVLPVNLNEVEKEAIAVAVYRGWIINRRDSVCLTDTGRDLVVHGNRLGPFSGSEQEG